MDKQQMGTASSYGNPLLILPEAPLRRICYEAEYASASAPTQRLFLRMVNGAAIRDQKIGCASALK
jgi:hypothetical protein